MSSGLTKTSKLFAAALILIMVVVHQDFWNWGVTERTFGGLPRGFAFQVGLSAAAALMWWIVTLVAWPKDEFAETESNDDSQSKVDQAKTSTEHSEAKA